MVNISFHNNTCTIRHQHWSYEFNKDFLTPPVWNSMRGLLLPAYPLTGQQAADLTTLFHKLHNEQNSTYIFAEALQRTYLIELIHFILKLNRSPKLKSF